MRSRWYCKECGAVCPRDSEMDVAHAVLAAINRAKLDQKFARRKLCEGLRWVADYIDERDSHEAKAETEDVREMQSE